MKKTDRILMYCIGIGQILMGLINMMLGSGVIYSIFLMSVGIVIITTIQNDIYSTPLTPMILFEKNSVKFSQ